RIDTEGRLIPTFREDYTNISIGYESLLNIDLSFGSVVIGESANKNGDNLPYSFAGYNTMVGAEAGYNTYNSLGNCYFGGGAGYNLNGGANVCIGLQSCTPFDNDIKEYTN